MDLNAQGSPSSSMPSRIRGDDESSTGTGPVPPAGPTSETSQQLGFSETGMGWWTEGLPQLRSQGGGTPQNIVTAFRPTGGTHGVDAGPLSPSLKVGTGLGIPSQPAVLISSAEDSPAKTSVSRGSDAVLPGSGRDSSLSSPESQMNFSLDGLSSRTFPDSSLPPVDEISESFSRPWSTSGMAWVGGASMLDTSEWPSDAVECSLSDVLVANPDQRYALSARAAKGILRRAAARGRTLPVSLHEALTVLASSGR